MMWAAHIVVSRNREMDCIVLPDTQAVPSSYIFWERDAMIEAVENWVESLEGLCGKNIIASR